MQPHILIVEDEPAIGEMIEISLHRLGFEVSVCADATTAKCALANHPIALLLVDWMLPGASGLELVRYLRSDELTRALPIIMLTARSEEADITAGLDAGADDYVTKPFSPQELNSRIKALLRRTRTFGDEDLRIGDLVCDVAAHRIEAAGVEVELGHTEFKLLHFLMSNPKRVYSRSQLLDHVWGRATFIEERTVDVHILRLRKNLKNFDLDGMIQTVRGAGYRLSES